MNKAMKLHPDKLNSIMVIFEYGRDAGYWSHENLIAQVRDGN